MAGSTKIEIVNIALTRIGCRTLSSLSQENETARSVNKVWDRLVDKVLAAGEWKFATKQAVLAVLSDEEVIGWEYVYAKPANCLHVQRVFSENTVLTQDPSKFDQLQAPISSQECIVTDEEDAWAQYTTRVSDPARFSPGFIDALAWALAAELAMPLTEEPNVAKTAMGQYEVAIARGRTQNHAGSKAKNPEATSYIDARG